MNNLDVRHLKPKTLAMLLNATPLGEVTSLPTIYRHQTRAGLRFGDGKYIDLTRYVAWLFQQRQEAMLPSAGLGGYEAMKEAARARNAELSAAGRDIGDLPAVVNPACRDAACASFRAFCQTYSAATFYLPWSGDHLKVMEKIEQAVMHGGLFAMAMPRGSGKTTLCEHACLWAILTGRRQFVCLIGSDEEHAAAMLESIKSALEASPTGVMARRIRANAHRSDGSSRRSFSRTLRVARPPARLSGLPGSPAASAE